MGERGVMDADRMQKIVAQHHGSLLRYAARITRSEDTARDVVQDVFSRLCREQPEDLNGHLAPWLYAACRNRAIDVRRKDSRMLLAADTEFFAIADAIECRSATTSGHDSANDPSAQAATREESAKVLRILTEFPANQQEAVCLRFSHCLSYKEIAAVMELSVSYVGVLLHTAIKNLRDKMSGRQASGSDGSGSA